MNITRFQTSRSLLLAPAPLPGALIADGTPASFELMGMQGGGFRIAYFLVSLVIE